MLWVEVSIPTGVECTVCGLSVDAKLPPDDETDVPYLLAKMLGMEFVAEFPLFCDVEPSKEEYRVVLLSLPGASDLELVNNIEPPESVA